MGSLASRWSELPHVARLAIAVILVQLLFWLAIKPLIIGSPTPGFDRIEGYNFSEAAIEAPTYAAVERATFSSIEELPAWHCCESGYRAFRYSFDLEEIPEAGLGLSAHVRADNYAIFVNGDFVAGTGRLELPDHTYDSLFRETHQIPKGTLNAGRNQVTFILVRDGIPYFDYFPPVLGEYHHIQSNMAPVEFLSNGYVYAVSVAIGMVALFSFIFFLISARDQESFWLFVLSASLAAVSYYYVWSDPPFDGTTRVAYFFALTIFVHFAWFAWANAWSRDQYSWILPASLAVFLVAAVAAVASLYAMETGPGYDRASEIMVYTGIAFSIATAARLLWNFRDLKEDRFLEAAIALLLVSLFALQAITELTEALNMGYMTRTQPFLIIGIAIAFFARRVTLFRSARQINALLQAQLEERTAELAVAHEREKRLVRHQAFDEERQRIMRDMHDGLGSHLMSMMMMAQRGAGTQADYAEGLQSVIDEMRLMIDSMDSVGESLRSALTVFRKRIVPRAQKAGFALHWRDDPDLTYPASSPSEILQVFRILQEAITNAFKHSGGDEIRVSIEALDEPEAGLRIAISDNGKGMQRPQKASNLGGGRGLKNMAARAKAIGAELDIQSDRTGTTVVVSLGRND